MSIMSEQPVQLRWNELAGLALNGLRATYLQADVDLPHTMKWDGAKATPTGFNVRYALISLLGLAKARSSKHSAEELDSILWNRICARRNVIDHSAGDLGLALWVQALTDRDGPFTAVQALNVLNASRDRLDSVNLAWLMLGSDHVLERSSNPIAQKLNEESKSALMRLWNSAANLFYRHLRRGPLATVSGRVPCFANQIYPVMALAVHARRTGCAESAKIGRKLADYLCQLQGSMGQWWWLYDAQCGGVVDGYPVFSVHQDGMAPMALMETTLAGGRTFHTEISRGLHWIFGSNELHTSLVMESQNLILRDIHKPDFGRIRRAMRSAAWTWGLINRTKNSRPSVFVVNSECRPYHLGWILYAAALANSGGTDAANVSCMEAAISCN